MHGFNLQKQLLGGVPVCVAPWVRLAGFDAPDSMHQFDVPVRFTGFRLTIEPTPRRARQPGASKKQRNNMATATAPRCSVCILGRAPVSYLSLPGLCMLL